MSYWVAVSVIAICLLWPLVVYLKSLFVIFVLSPFMCVLLGHKYKCIFEIDSGYSLYQCDRCCKCSNTDEINGR